MSFLGDLLGGITGTVGNVLDSKADSWLNELITGEKYPGAKNDKKALKELKELKKIAKEREDPNFTNTQIDPTLVDYAGTVAAPQVTSGQSAQVTGPGATAYNPGKLVNQTAGDAAQGALSTYNASLMEQLQALQANTIDGQQIANIPGYKEMLAEAAKMAPAETYTAATAGPTSKIKDNTQLKDQLMNNLGTLQEKSKQGFDQTDRMMNNEVMSEAATNATRMGDAVRADMQARGVAGGGSELAQRLLANAQASKDGNSKGIALAKEARDRKDAALKDASSLASTMRAQDVDISKADTSAENQFKLSNQNAFNQASQFNTNAKNDVNKTNAGFQQQTNLSNQDATNSASQFNKNLEWNQASKNADLAQDSNKFNADARNTNDRFNQETLFNTNRSNMDASNQASQFNAGQSNDMSRFNTQEQNRRTEYNTGVQNDTNLANFQAGNEASRFNASEKNAMDTRNADRTQQNNQFNVSEQGTNNRFNAGTLVDVNKYNQDNRNAQSRDNANIINDVATGNRDHTYQVESGEYTAGQNNFTNQLNIGKLLADYYYNASDRDARLAAAAAAQGGSKKGTSGGFLSGLLGAGVKGLTGLFGFEDGGLTPEGIPYVVGESGPEWAVNTEEGTAVAPMQTGHFQTDMMNMFQDPQAGPKPAVQTLNKDKQYYFPPKYDFRGGM